MSGNDDIRYCHKFSYVFLKFTLFFYAIVFWVSNVIITAHLEFSVLSICPYFTGSNGWTRCVWLTAGAVCVVQLHRTTMARCCSSKGKVPRHSCHPFSETCSAQFLFLLRTFESTGVVPAELTVRVVTWEPCLSCRHTLPRAPLPSLPVWHVLINRGRRDKQLDTTGYFH